MNNFDIFRYKEAGMTNLGVNLLIKFHHQHSQKLGLRQTAQVAQLKSIADFMERYKNQDVKLLRECFNQFPSFSILDDVYPARLREIYNPPTLLFYQGNLELLKRVKLAFVGSRDCSTEGQQAVTKIIKELCQETVVVSGLARGIDTASHVAAIKTETPTIAVIGTGLDVHYPLENAKLQDYMAEHQLVLTEYGPGEKPLKWHFPDRNRIIAGLSKGVVVFEAKLRSGSLITAERAMEEGRDVFAVPGSIVAGYSDGCNALIQEGAKLVYCGRDILDEYVSV
ncbi:MAG: DNA-processing protein DprA [Streptococcaceae bacterium]|jgi:DNA processing protein|nr:DNA-processing protein DprA [Streptococcaceae bacterium]